MKAVMYSVTAFVCLAACSGSDSAKSGLLGSGGDFLVPLEDAAIGTANFPGTNNGYAFQVGLNSSRSQFLTEAALLDGANLPAPQMSGDAELTAAYELETFQFPVTDANGLTGTRQSVSGDMTLVLDFAQGTISGADNGLALDGTIDPTGAIVGTASFEDMSGALAGDASNTQAIGIFNGQSVTGVFAGGFIAE